ncbi:hypothetical protein BST95_13750 [Halioglobus japonicus]|uniref:Tetratricopeptide repeat-containing protein n=1 Tax=Halioglobus japonicus TaxID=930805 RepID=A0AAP8SPM3_9GAMM|nr:tetratricopeptide repeat protein [Halioglobus japonicus]AQA19147.1 hypothetical protein BST95_13750 [Halioglobus japonicus]PLW87825.1 tetratricopeptide repeat-containing protein [Halioglobus japonicus]GHD06365.1 hypothetical protein GCM10007052_01050 [Halioglobus japonicus]
MLIKPLLLALLLSQFVAVALAQDTGQYRSRVLLDPLGDIGKGSEMSLQELEQSIDSIRDPYARSSATRHLARHYVNEGDYPAAIAWYREALRSDGLSAVANREMRRELAQVYLQAEEFAAAASLLDEVLAMELVPATGDFLLLAQARYRLGDYVAVVVALDGVQAAGLTLDEEQKPQALALYYRAGAYPQCETLLRELLVAAPQEADYWHQLVSVYLQQNKRQAALDQLMLAMEQGVDFDPSQYVLLVDLLAVNGNPYGAASLLEQLMAAGALPRSGAHLRKVFELWFQARERDRAQQALVAAARETGDTELYLYLAQLQLEDEAWPDVEQTVLSACQRRLEDRFVSRANLLLGVSLLKQGRDAPARQVLINATLVGGAHQQAAQWLKFMDAVPPNEDELRRVRGPCVGSEGKQLALIESMPQQPAPTQPEIELESADVDTVTVLEVQRAAATRYFFAANDEPLEQLLPQMRTLAVRQSVSLVKASGTADGAPQFLNLQNIRGIGIPLRGNAQARGRYRVVSTKAFDFVSFAVFPEAGVEAQLAAALASLEKAGIIPSGGWRLVPDQGQNGSLQLQLGVMAPVTQ